VCCTVGPRGIVAKREGAPVDVDYSGGKLAPDNWAMVKGSKNPDAVYQFLNFVIDGKVQAEFAKRVPYGPSSSGAFNFLSEAEAKDLITSPDNLKKQFWNDIAWGCRRHRQQDHIEAQTERHADGEDLRRFDEEACARRARP
jgi:putative spermidine/putrescine transport system substrate-binding protein